ncbi:MAG: siderophore-interacting protein [Actinomycetota bacterium]
MTTPPDASSTSLAERLGVRAVTATVQSVATLSPSLAAVTLSVPDIAIAGVPGNDVMISIAKLDGSLARRRYSVRSTNAEESTVTFWVTTHHDGLASEWLRSATPGAQTDLVGPRGKIVLDPLADWYLFVGEISALGAFYNLAEAIEIPGKAIFIVEVPEATDIVTTSFDPGLGVTGIFIERQGRAPSDAEGILRGLAAFEFPEGHGHAYLFGEFSQIKAAKLALLDRGLTEDQISSKAFWRQGKANQDHGEPDKTADS